MYFHISNNFPIKKDTVLGIFDIESTTVGNITRDYLAAAQKKFEIVNATDGIPNTFIVTVGKDRKSKTVYLSNLSTQTLTKRYKEKTNA